MISARNFIQNYLEKSRATRHNSHLNIYFRIQDDVALSDGEILLIKNALKLFFFNILRCRV